MRRIHAVFLLAALAAACSRKGTNGPSESRSEVSESGGDEANAEETIKTEEVTYRAGDVELKGFLALPAKVEGKVPGVLVVHEWWGLNGYVRGRAQKLAELGYAALAIDMYGGGRNTQHPEDAKKFMGEVLASREEAARRFDAGRAALAQRPEVDADHLAAIGYCFGGAQVLAAARRGESFDLVASFHGNYATQTPMPKDGFAGKIFIAHGGADTFTAPEQIDAVKKELDAAGARYEFVVYEGAKHGFTNPEASALAQKTGLDVGYDHAADEQSWSKLLELLREAFPEAPPGA